MPLTDLRLFPDEELFNKLKDALRERPELTTYFVKNHVSISDGLEDILENVAKTQQTPISEKGRYNTMELRLLKGIYHEFKDRDRRDRRYPERLGDFGKILHYADQFYNVRFPYSRKNEDNKDEPPETDLVVM